MYERKHLHFAHTVLGLKRKSLRRVYFKLYVMKKLVSNLSQANTYQLHFNNHFK